MLLPYDGSFSARLLHCKSVPQISEQSLTCLKEVFSQLFNSRTIIKEAKYSFKEKGIDFHKVFSEMDQCKKGYLEKEDFKYFIKNLRPEFKEGPYEELTVFIRNCDLDRDGKVTFKDFYMFFSL